MKPTTATRPQPSEYERLLIEIAPVLQGGGQGLALASLDDKNIDWLADVIGIARENIVRLVQIEKLGLMASRLSELLTTLPVPLTLEQHFAIVLAGQELRAEDPQLVERITALAGFDAASAAAVARTLRLDALTLGHLRLVRVLQLRLVGERGGGLEFLTALEADDWLDLVFTHGTPDESDLAREDYLAALAAGIEQYSPNSGAACHATDE